MDSAQNINDAISNAQEEASSEVDDFAVRAMRAIAEAEIEG